jgi:hypothetical protein
VLGFAHTALLLLSIGHDLILVIGVPGCVGHLNFNALTLKSLELLNSFVVRHRDFKFLLIRELVGLQVGTQNQISSILHRNIAAEILDSLQSVARGVRNFDVNRLVERIEVLDTLSKKLNTMRDFGDDTSVKQSFHVNRLRSVNLSLLNVVSELSQVERGEVNTIVEAILTETKLREPLLQARLATLKATVNSTASTSKLTLVTSA